MTEGTGNEAAAAVPEVKAEELTEEKAKEELTEPEQESCAEDAQEQPEALPGEPKPEKAETEAEHEAEPEAEEPPEEKAPEESSLEARLERLEKEFARRENELFIKAHFESLERQAETLKESFPEFDLRTELGDPVFLRLTSPEIGLSVEDAYHALHHREIAEAGAKAAAEMIGNSVKAGKSMPQENGTVQRGTPQGFRALAELSPEERKIRMDLIRSGRLRFD